MLWFRSNPGKGKRESTNARHPWQARTPHSHPVSKQTSGASEIGKCSVVHFVPEVLYPFLWNHKIPNVDGIFTGEMSVLVNSVSVSTKPFGFCLLFFLTPNHHYVICGVFFQEEYRAEGISWHNIDYIDNSSCISLISKKPTGLLHLLDEESKWVGKCWLWKWDLFLLLKWVYPPVFWEKKTKKKPKNSFPERC